MTAAQWDEAMHPDKSHREAYAYAEVKVREALSNLPERKEVSTGDLVDLLYSGENDDTQDRMFKALKTLAHAALRDCWRHGEEVKRYGRMVRPKLWHRPAVRRCPHCHGELP